MSLLRHGILLTYIPILCSCELHKRTDVRSRMSEITVNNRWMEMCTCLSYWQWKGLLQFNTNFFHTDTYSFNESFPLLFKT